MVNKVILIGNVGQKPTSRETSNGKIIANCTLATSMKSKGETTTEWHRLVFFDKTAELAVQYLDKGSKLYVEGRIQYRKFTNKDGVEQHSTEIIVSDMKFLGDAPSKKSSGGGGYDDAPPPPHRVPAPSETDNSFPF